VTNAKIVSSGLPLADLMVSIAITPEIPDADCLVPEGAGHCLTLNEATLVFPESQTTR